jgi:hypothetical protein
MILQAIVAPLPAFLITLANAALFGAFWGGTLSWFEIAVDAAQHRAAGELLHHLAPQRSGDAKAEPGPLIRSAMPPD